jgi:hypothetical protein
VTDLSPQGGYAPRQQPAGKQTIGPRQTAITVVAVIVIVGPLFGFAIYMANKQSEERSVERAGFQPAITNLLSAVNDPAPGTPRPKVGKVVLIDADKRTVDQLQPYLPDDIHAKTPAEVTTVGQMRYMRNVVGKFESGGRAVQLTAKLTVVDVPSRTVIATRSFDWGKPPLSVPVGSGADDVIGSPPVKEINAFLKGLQ